MKARDESGRLRELQRLAVLDTSAESAYDAITKLAASAFGVPTALISLVDADRQWFKSRVGMEETETPREHAFCAVAIEHPDAVTLVADATKDDRFAGNPYVTGAPGIRFYAGAPLLTSSGYALGTVCVLDTEPRQVSREQLEELEFLATQVVGLLEARQSHMKSC